MSQEFQAGELVDIHIRGRVMEDSSKRHCLQVEYRQPEHLNATPYKLILPLSSPDLIVERVEPADWPPQQGDLWRDRDGGLWFAQDDGASDVTPPVMWMVPSAPRRGSDGMQAARLLTGHSPLTLVYRREGGTR